MPEEVSALKNKKQAITVRDLVYKYIRYLPWLIISVAVALTLAYVKLYYSVPIYSVSSKMLVGSMGSSGGMGKFDDIFSVQSGSMKLNDEIEIFKSRPIAARVIKHLGLQTTIVNKGKIRNSQVHLLEAPFIVDVMNPNDSTDGFYMLITVDDAGYTMNEDKKKYVYGELVDLGNVKLRILKSNRDLKSFGSNQFIVYRQDLESMAAGLSGSIGVAPVTDFSTVLRITYNTENVRLGKEIVNQYVYEYQENSLEDKRQIAANALDFISQQLDTVKRDLSGVEGNLQRFQEVNRIVSTEQQAGVYFGQLTANDERLAQQAVKLRVIDLLIQILSDRDDPYKIVPSVLGTDEPVLLHQITEYNKLQLERETALRTTPAGNPIIRNLETPIEKLRGDMIINLQNVRKTYQLVYDDIKDKIQEADRRISSMPAKEKQLLDVRRQQGILQELYSYLLQKKLETAIGSASTISNIKVVEPAMYSGQVSPNSKSLYMMAFIIGLAIPTAIIALKELLNDKVTSKADIQQVTDAPILGEIGHAKDSSTLIVTHNNRKLLAEQFRIIRANVQYIFPKVDRPVIHITSSFSGEGKSFISTNLGAVLALSGRKTVILEFDIRKPKIMKGLGLNERRGITNYIVGNMPLDAIIYPVPEVQNLFVIPCGPVPPNPAEMLLDPRVKDLFTQLRLQFDVVIIDTAPVGMVGDAFTLSKHADASVYIVRHNYTLKKQIQLIDDIYRNKKLPHLSIIVNDIESRGGYDGYYGYGGYGYGYGYGVGNSSAYYDENDRPGFFQRVFRKKKHHNPY